MRDGSGMLIHKQARKRIHVLAALGLAVAMLVLTPWSSHAQSPSATRAPFDHAAYDALLRQHVKNGFVDYDAFAKAPAFAQYLASLDAAHPEQLDDDERLAFWINVFNAYTIQLIVSHHETASIRNINKTFGVLQLKGPWNEPLVRVGGKRLTLDWVQHAILRKEFGEARVHFTLACGAVGCPPLRSEAYTGAKLLAQFDDQAHVFLRQSPSKNRVMGRAVFLSPVLLAYRGDFGPGREDLAHALAPYFDGDTKTQMQKGRVAFRESRFDWTLNSVTNVRAVERKDSVSAPPM